MQLVKLTLVHLEVATCHSWEQAEQGCIRIFKELTHLSISGRGLLVAEGMEPSSGGRHAARSGAQVHQASRAADKPLLVGTTYTTNAALMGSSRVSGTCLQQMTLIISLTYEWQKLRTQHLTSGRQASTWGGSFMHARFGCC